ncbi:unnamed protein product [Rotaria sp. Silwood2]|nr:unnamed protein product [Rotaria sp. Silwood2]
MNATHNDVELITRLSNISLYIMRHGLLIMIILDLVGNVMTVFIFRQPKLRANPCSFYLISTAYANLLWILTSPFVRMLSTFGLDLSERINVLCKMRRSLAYALSSLSMISVALATVDRFLVSSTHVGYRQLSSLRSAYRLVAINTIICCLIFFVFTLNIDKSQLRSKIETLFDDATFFFTTFQSSFSFYIYATSGGQLFRQTLRAFLRSIISKFYRSTRNINMENIVELQRLRNHISS